MAGLGRVIKQRRERLGWARDQLAERAGVSPSFVFRLEHGYGNDFGVGKVAALARALGASVEELLAEATEAACRRPALRTAA